LYALPEITVGGTQVIDFYTPYAATQFYIDVWPVQSAGLGETYIQFDPPTFANICISQGWSWTMIKAWVDWEFQLYEWSAGLFSYLLR